MASFMTTAAILAPISFFKVPPNVPIAVLHAETMTTSFIFQSPYSYNYFLLLKLGVQTVFAEVSFSPGPAKILNPKVKIGRVKC